jgi:hypothetical protein
LKSKQEPNRDRQLDKVAFGSGEFVRTSSFRSTKEGFQLKKDQKKRQKVDANVPTLVFDKTFPYNGQVESRLTARFIIGAFPRGTPERLFRGGTNNESYA